jgi:uncharacterized membrane protein
MPLIQNFRSTSLTKAFILNSMVASITVVLAIAIKDGLDRFTNYNKNEEENKSDFSNIIITLIITYCVSMLTYIFMFYVFGFGGGMLSN